MPVGGAALVDVVDDRDQAEAVLGRLLEYGAPFTRRGRSYRIRHLAEEEATTRRSRPNPLPMRQNLEEYRDRIRRNFQHAADPEPVPSA